MALYLFDFYDRAMIRDATGHECAGQDDMERHQHDQRLIEDRRREHRELVEVTQGLTRGTRDIRCAG